MNLCAEIFKGMNTPDGKPSAETLERWKELTDGLVEEMAMQEKETDKLKAENEELRANLREALRQNEVMNARLEMVHLIFGRNR